MATAGTEKGATQAPPDWEHRVAVELERTAPPKWRVAFWVFLQRFTIRLLRISLGLILGLVSLWLFGKAGDHLGKPFSELSPLELIFSGLGVAGLALAATGAALGLAFGEGKPRQAVEESMASQRRLLIESNLRAHDRDLRQRALVYSNARTVGRWFARLLRGIGRKPPKNNP